MGIVNIGVFLACVSAGSFVAMLYRPSIANCTCIVLTLFQLALVSIMVIANLKDNEKSRWLGSSIWFRYSVLLIQGLLHGFISTHFQIVVPSK